MEEVRDNLTDETFRGMIRCLSIHEIFLYFIVIPSLMVIIYFLPTPVKHDYFILYSNSTDVYSLFLNNYTHSESLHIISNLTVSFMVMFLLFNTETDKRIFRVMMALIFLLLPWLLSFASLDLIKNLPPSQGVSGVVAALLGYLTFSVYRYVRQNYKADLAATFPVFIFAINGSLVTIILSGVSNLAIALVVFTIIVGILNIREIIATAKELTRRMRIIKSLNVSYARQQGIFYYRLAIVILSVALMFSLVSLVPKNPVEGSTLTNYIAHFVGYVFGLFIPTVFEAVRQMAMAAVNWKKSSPCSSSSAPSPSPLPPWSVCPDGP